MELFKNSAILSALDRLWGKICREFSRGLLCRLCLWLWHFVKESYFISLLTGRHETAEAWRESAICRAVLQCANLVPNLLSKLYKRFPRFFGGSLFLRYADILSIALICTLTLLMFVTPQESWKNTYSLLGAFGALGLYWLSGMADDKKRLSFKGLGAYPVVFSAVTLCSALWSQQISVSFRFVFFSVTCMVLVLVLVNAVQNEKQLMAVVGSVCAGLIVCSAYAIYQNHVGVKQNASFTDLTVNADMPGRVFSFFENPNSFANLLVLFLPLMLCMFFCGKRWYGRLGALGAFGLGCLAILMTYSRGGWLALAFSIFVLMLIVCPRYVPLLIIFGCMALPVLPDSILNRLLTIFTGDSSIGTRGVIYSSTLGVIASSPVLGVGLGMQALRSAAYIGGFYTLIRVPYIHAHNIYLQLWGESGILALVFFVLTMVWAVARSARAAVKTEIPSRLKAVNAGCAAGMCGSLLFGITDYAWSYPRVMVIFWLLYAIMCAASKLSDNK